MGLLDWFRRRRKRPIVADQEGKSPYEQAKAVIQKQKAAEALRQKAEEGSEVTLEKFDAEKAKPKPKAKPKRARTKKGTYKADDKSTPDVNEAWEGGKAPKPKAKVTRVKKKK
jgi:hypothetical protein